jgi:hypothetical protein
VESHPQGVPPSLIQYLSTQETPIIDIHTEMLQLNTTYTFTVRVTDVRGQWELAKKKVTRIDQNIPTVQIYGSDVMQHIWSRPSVHIYSFGFSCVTENLSYKWTQVGGPPIVGPVDMTQSSLLLVQANFATYGMYEFTVNVTDAFGKSAYDRVFISVVMDPVQAVISGGSFRALSNAARSITLDGSSSIDPANFGVATYLWECSQTDDSPCPSDIAQYIKENENDDYMTIPFATPHGMEFRFKLTYTKGDRTSVAYQTVRTLNGARPLVSLDGLPPTVNSNDKVAIYGSYFVRNAVSRSFMIFLI